MQILDLEVALEKDRVSKGSVYLNEAPVVRTGKKNDFMVGRFLFRKQSVEFKIWEEAIFAPVQKHGVGIYDVEVVGSEFNGVYLTVRKIAPTADAVLKKNDFLERIPPDVIKQHWTEVLAELTELGVSYRCWRLVENVIRDPILEGRFMTEGAAVRHHDNKIGGLVWHTTKMLRLLGALLRNNPELKASADLLAFSILVHDLGKVFEYNQLEMAEYWYAGHRVRGIEFLTRHRDAIFDAYDEAFYRQVQSAIAGHHGEYGDRPTTVAAAIVHYIDTLESQVTGLIQDVSQSQDGRILLRDWGYLKSIALTPENPVGEGLLDKQSDSGVGSGAPATPLS